MITNPGSVETRYESAVYRGTTLFRRHLVTMIEYAEVYVGKELSLSEFHDLVRNVITDVNIQGGASETLQNAFSRLQMRADIQTCRQLFMGFKKLDIIVVSKDLLGDWLDS